MIFNDTTQRYLRKNCIYLNKFSTYLIIVSRLRRGEQLPVAAISSIIVVGTTSTVIVIAASSASVIVIVVVCTRTILSEGVGRSGSLPLASIPSLLEATLLRTVRRSEVVVVKVGARSGGAALG